MDIKQAEQLVQFKSFFDFIQDPKSVAKMIKELNDAVVKYKDTMEVAMTVEQARSYRQEAKNVLENAQVQRDAQEANNVEVKKAFDADMRVKQAKFEEQMAQFQADITVQKQKQADMTNVQYSLDVLNAKLLNWQDRLQQKENELVNKEAVLNDKAVKIKQLLG